MERADPIQMQAIPKTMERRDLYCAASTGIRKIRLSCQLFPFAPYNVFYGSEETPSKETKKKNGKKKVPAR
jgi:hypothetical protein